MEERIAWAMLSNPVFKTACQEEKLNIDWAAVRRLAGVHEDVIDWHTLALRRPRSQVEDPPGFHRPRSARSKL